MAGRSRRRRASSASTTGVVGSSQTRWAQESAILKPKPQDSHSDSWDCYVLTDATIYRKDGKTLANPLFVDVEGPLIVRGFLEVDDPELFPNLVRQNVKSAYVEIPCSERYSIGDGPVTLWVSGAAGWFEIRPSVRYEPMFTEIREAITLYYSALVVYEQYNTACRGKKKATRPSPPTFDNIFLEYAVKTGDGILRHEVDALYHKWAGFLISHFDKETELDWNKTLFAQQLRASYPDIVKRIADIASGAMPPLPIPETQDSDEDEVSYRRRLIKSKSRASSQTSEPKSGMRQLSLDRPRSTQPKPPKQAGGRMTETPVPLPEKYRQLTEPASSKASSAHAETPKDTPMSDVDSESPVERLLSVLQEIAGETDVKKVTATSIRSRVYPKCKIRQYASTGDILAYYAKDLLPRLGPEWLDTPWYEWVKQTAGRPWTPTSLIKPEEIPAQTFRRTKMVPKPPTTAKPATTLPTVIKTKKAVQSDNESDSEDGIAGSFATPQTRNRRSGKGATLTLKSTSKKRPRSDLYDHDGSRRGRKSAKVFHRGSEDDDQSESALDTSDDETVGEDAAIGSHLPLPEGAVRVVVHAERIPTTSPSGPDGTWTCDQEGCAYVVRSADDQDAQELIREHFREHEAHADKIDLAVKESRGHMPINHLLSKIQALGKAAFFRKQDTTLDGKPVPAPVKRRLLI